MNAHELRDKTPDELRDQLASLKKEAFNLRFQQATSQLENTARMRSVRRDVARVKTVLNEMAAGAASGDTSEPTSDAPSADTASEA
ncbi:MAG: 50S ribosomal protein L29 [Pseudomonadota bacterium]